MISSDGPFLNVATVCEKVLQEQDGTLTAVRLIDRVFFMLTPDGSLQLPRHPIVFYIALKSGSARGRFAIDVEREKPSGEVSPIFSFPVLFEGEERGVNIVVNALFEPDQEGLYWFNVRLTDPQERPAADRPLLTRVPLRAVYQPMPTVGPQG
jgi:hypothetical protein